MTKQEFESKYGVSYNDMLDQYANDYLYDVSGGEGVVEQMDLFEEFLDPEMTPYEAFERALFAYRYDDKGDWEGHELPFSMNDEWFALDAYANYVSMSDNERMRWLDRKIDDTYFIDWLIEHDYVEAEESDEYEEEE